jgi:superfamily II DNA or RNA helicase
MQLNLAMEDAKQDSAVPGFYVAHHKWLDSERGSGTLYKVGHTGDLRRRLNDDAYITCFSPGWRFVYTIETAAKLDAHRLEAGVLDCLISRRIKRANGTLSELVRASKAEIIELASSVASILSITPVKTAALPVYTRPPAKKTGGVEKQNKNAQAQLTPYERSSLVALRERFKPPIEQLIHSMGDMTLKAVPNKKPGPANTMKAYMEKARTRARERARARVNMCAQALAGTQTGTLDTQDDDEDETFADILLDPDDDLQEAMKEFDALSLESYQAPELEYRKYQADAMKDCIIEMNRKGGPGRAVLQMACRCGKTRVAHGIMCEYINTPRGSGPVRILYLVPGLSLLRQTVYKLDKYGFGPPKTQVMLVGSDDRPVADLKSLQPCLLQQSVAASTDPNFIASVCAKTKGPLLVISTYQSSPLLPDTFDLTVFDESHRVCGDVRARPFTHALLQHDKGHRLYMTATPRYDAPLSMKNKEIFGGVAYAYHMRQGIDAGYVNDFVLELVGREVGQGSTGSRPDNDATGEQVVAAFDSLQTNKYAGKLLVFCRSIRHATRLCAEVMGALKKRGADCPVCVSAHSRMPRSAIAANLAAFCAPGTSAILFNCRLFQEGVEIPTLNGVFFASPRHSPRDIIQSLCRPLNVLPNKPPSKVFIPVAVDGGAKPDSVDNLKRFASIIPYFDALIAEDPLLYEHLLDPRGTPYPLKWVNSAVSTTGVCKYDPDKLLAAARRSVRRGGNGRTERLLRSARIPWEIGFAELKRIVVECGRYPKTTDCFVYGDAKVNFGQFYRYARDSYLKWKNGKPQPLEPHQLRALESLPGWEPYGLEGPYPWRQTLNFLEKWLEGNGGAPPMVEINKGGYVGLEATDMERLSGTLTCVNQSDGRDRRSRKTGKSRPGSGFILDSAKQKDLDELCARWNLRWRKQRKDPPPGSPEGSVGSLLENNKGEYIGEKTFIQKAYARFKAEWAKVGKGGGSDYIQKWFPGYPLKHAHQEREDVWARRKELVPPRWRGRGKTAKTTFDASKSIFL